MEVKQLKDIIKIWVNARGITNGELDVNSIEYVEGSDLDRLIQFIKNNGLNDEVILNQILSKLEEYGDKIILQIDDLGSIVNQIIIEVIQNELSIHNNQLSLEQIKNIIDESNLKTQMNFIEVKNIFNKQSSDLNNTLKKLTDKIEPKVIVQKEVEYQTRYIEVQTTQYVYVHRQEDVKPTEVNKIDRGTVPPAEFKNKDTSWKPFHNDWLIKQDNNTYYFKRKFESDSRMLRKEEFVASYGRNVIGVKLLEMGIITTEKAQQTGVIYTSASKSVPKGADPFKWKWTNNLWG